jgi:hypothetical protein
MEKMETIKNNLGKVIFLIAIILAIFGYAQYAQIVCKFADNPELCLQEIATKKVETVTQEGE